MEHHPLNEEEGGMSAALSDLTRSIAILAAPHGYVATARLLGGAHGDRLLLRAQRRMAGLEYSEEVSLDTLQRVGPAAVASAFDRAARAAFAPAASAKPPVSRPAKG